MSSEDEKPVKVIFRKWAGTNVVMALFPDMTQDRNPRMCAYLEQGGPHGYAFLAGVLSHTLAAAPDEYAPLQRELEEPPHLMTLDIREDS